jgi:FixJ family two-component response regulator
MSGKSTYPVPSTLNIQRQPGVVIIDDDVELTRAVARVLRSRYNCIVRGYSSVEAFLDNLDHPSPGDDFQDRLDLILVDFHLPGRNGPKLIKELARRRSPLLGRTHIMGITGDGEARVITEFNDVGIEEILQKPLRKLDFGNIADKAYRICSGQDHIASPRAKMIEKYI